GKKVRRQLDRAPHTRPDHRGPYAAVYTPDPLGAEDLPHAVDEVPVPVLGADGPEGRVALQAGLDEEEGAPRGGADHARRGAAEHVDAHALDGGVAEDEAGEGLAHGLVEAEAAPVEDHLVDVGGAEAAVDAAHALVADD